jgi:NAD(P)-dependent dehydrogenase (short-subunit alcohol dehydrogenase family)
LAHIFIRGNFMKSLAELGRLEGRVAVVTGGAGHLGRVFGEALAELGCRVVVVDREKPITAEAASALAVGRGVETLPLAIDLDRPDSADEVVRHTLARFSRLDILINNAAFTGASHLAGWAVPLEQQRFEAWEAALRVNLSAAFLLSQAARGALAESGHGSIVNVGSIYGMVGPDLALYEGTEMGNPAAYAASKGGLIQLTRYLATVLAPEIRVNSLSPGGIERGQPLAFQARYVARTPLGRMGHEEDFKGAIAYLATDLSAWVTGQNLVVDGGWTAW